MTQSVVIHGPQGCGKTLNGQRLRRHFGLSHIWDEGMHAGPPPWSKPMLPDTLVLTNKAPPAHVAKTARVLSFAEAMRLAGFARSPSTASN